MSLSERIAIGRSTESGCSSSHWAIARARAAPRRSSPGASRHPSPAWRRACDRARPRPSAGSGRSGARRRAGAAPSRRPGSSRRRAWSASPRASRRAAGRDSAAAAHPPSRRCAAALLTPSSPSAPCLRGNRASAHLAASSPWAIAAISDSANRPSSWPMSAIRGSACMTAKFESGALAAMRPASSSALARPCAGLDPVLRQADRLAFVGVVDAAGEHHVGHPRDADQARDARRAAAADEQAALAFGQAVEGARLGDADVAGARQLEPAADHGAVQHRDHRHPAELDLVERRMPGARMQDAFGDAALRAARRGRARRRSARPRR